MLYAATKRFVFDFRVGHTKPIAGEMVCYRDSNTSRGVAYGALWAALVRVATVYSRTDGKTIDAGSGLPTKAISLRKRRTA